jgi:hypothetical protein
MVPTLFPKRDSSTVTVTRFSGIARFAPVTPSTALVLFTDGLVERRGEVIDQGLVPCRDWPQGAVVNLEGRP